MACKALLLRALDLARNAHERALTLAALAKIEARLGELEAAREIALEALGLDPTDKDAFKRAVALELKIGSPEGVLALVDRTLSQGVFNSRVISSRALAFAKQGRMDEVRASQGADEFLKNFDPAPPEGRDTLADFTRDPRQELCEHADMR